MRSNWMRGLLVLVFVSSAASLAVAQSGVYGTPSQLPSNTPSYPGGGAWPVSYDYYSRPTTPGSASAASFNSSFLSSQEPGAMPSPQAVAPAISQEYAQGLQQTCWDNNSSCGSCNSCGSCCGGSWFASGGGLVMGRNRPNGYWTTYETNNNVNQLVNTQHAGAQWGGGGQITVGYNICPCGPAFAVTYWGVTGMDGSYSVRSLTNELSTPIDLNTQSGSVMIGARTAASYFDNSREHRIERNDQVQNIELTLLQGNMVNNGRLQMIGLAGFRYFRFDEGLSFGAAAGGHEFGEPGGADEAYLNFRAVNNLYGFQIGSIFNYVVTPRLGIFATPKFGVYGNQMNVRAHLYAGDGTEGFDIYAHKTDVSFLGELDFGFNYAVTPNLRAFLGYRVVAVTGIALADNAFLPFLADSAGFAQVKQNGDLVLHGAFIGASYAF